MSLATSLQNRASLPLAAACVAIDESEARSRVSVLRPCSPAILDTAISIAWFIVAKSMRISRYSVTDANCRSAGKAELHADSSAYDTSWQYDSEGSKKMGPICRTKRRRDWKYAGTTVELGECLSTALSSSTSFHVTAFSPVECPPSDCSSSAKSYERQLTIESVVSITSDDRAPSSIAGLSESISSRCAPVNRRMPPAAAAPAANERTPPSAICGEPIPPGRIVPALGLRRPASRGLASAVGSSVSARNARVLDSGVPAAADSPVLRRHCRVPET
mmetsp:Transcript_31753/g.83182  ORF Transcript_31753/g.83182 Transcript_31753/m.83182 type:complete len:276 (-) Transcript_31753:871-1698(-)